MPVRDILMARDCYDDCIAFLDEQLGKLLDELQRQGLLDNTLVIITSDHGEAFGDHRLFGHGNSVYLDEIGVPLVILSPGAPAGRVVVAPVSLRDLPATVLDQLGLADGSPFPGHSLAAYWRRHAGTETPADQPSHLRAGHSSRVRTSNGPSPRVPVVIGGSGPPLLPWRFGVRAPLRFEQRSVRAGQSCELPGRQSTRTGLSADAPRCADGQPRLDRSGKCLPGGLQAMA